MPKITRHGGLTVHTGGQVLLPAVAEVNVVELGELPARERPSDGAHTRVDLEEEPWPGSSSETSDAKPPKSDEPKKPKGRRLAPTTAGRSKNTKGSGTAQTATTSGPDA